MVYTVQLEIATNSDDVLEDGAVTDLVFNELNSIGIDVRNVVVIDVND